MTCFVSNHPSASLRLWLLVCLCSAISPGRLPAQAEKPESPPKALLHEVVRFGGDAVVAADESVSEVVVFHGDATVEGEVRDTVVVFGGDLKVTGEIRGDVVVVFGNIEASSTAVLRRPAIVIGGKIQAQPGSKLRPDNFVLNQTDFPLLRGFLSWVTQGAFYLRPLPPRVLWSWSVPLAFLFLYAFLGLILSSPTEHCVRVLVERPMASYLVGLLGSFVLLLCLPFIVIFGAIGIGFLVLLVLIMVVLFGRMVVVRFVGFQLGQQLGVQFLQRPLVSLLLGSLILCAIYMVPVIGLGVWVGIFPLAVGSVLLAGMQAMRPGRPLAVAPAATGAPDIVTTTMSPNPPPAPPAPPSLSNVAGKPAGFFVRTAASLLDLIVVICLSMLLGLGARGFLLLWMGYQVALWSWSGATLGARAFGLVLVETDGRPVHFQVAMVRGLASFLSALPLFLGFIWVAWDLRKQSWHDKLAGTIIVWR